MTYTQHQQYAPPAGDVPLWAPLYGASAPDAVLRFFKKYTTFSGRASRSEYWWWALINAIVTILFYHVLALARLVVGAVVGTGPITLILLGLWLLATIVPGVALTVRRLHDANLSGWLVLLGLIPLVGSIILLVFVLMAPKPEGQRFDRPASVQERALASN